MPEEASYDDLMALLDDMGSQPVPPCCAAFRPPSRKKIVLYWAMEWAVDRWVRFNEWAFDFAWDSAEKAGRWMARRRQ